MIRAGLTGGYGCGKSFVSRLLEEWGCHVIRADELGHRVLARDGEAYEGVVAAFGGAILDADGSINRKRLAEIVFNLPESLERLNSIVHPAVIRLEEQFLDNLERTDPSGIGIVEAAILIETGSYRRFDKLIVVACTQAQQLQRAVERDGISIEQARARIARQMPVDKKRAYADYVIETSGSKEETVRQTSAVYEALRSLVK